MKKILIKLSITLIVFLGLVWLSQSSYTTETVIVREIYYNGIIVENFRGNQQHLKIPQILNTLIEIDTEYRVKHKKRVWESKPVIFKIERNDKN